MRALYLRHEYAVLYVVSAAVYIVVGMHVRFLLNWIVGPLWPVVCLWFLPPLVRRTLGWNDPLPDEQTP